MLKLVCHILPDSQISWLPGWLAYHSALFGQSSLAILTAPGASLPATLISDCQRRGIKVRPIPPGASWSAIDAAKEFAGPGNSVALCPPDMLMACADPQRGISLAAITITKSIPGDLSQSAHALHAVSTRFDCFDLLSDPGITLHSAPATTAQVPKDGQVSDIIAIRLPDPAKKIAKRANTDNPLLYSESLAKQLRQAIPASLWPKELPAATTTPGKRNNFDFIDVDDFNAAAYLAAHPNQVKSLSDALAQYCKGGYRNGQLREPGEAGLRELMVRMHSFREDNPQRPVGITPLAAFATDPNAQSEIIAILEAGLRKFPGNLQVVNAARRAAFETRNFARAAELALKLIDISPDSPLHYIQAITAYTYASLTQEGESIADQAIERFPNELGVFKAAAELAKLRGDTDAMNYRWERILSLAPNDPKLHTLAAEMRYAGLLGPQDDDDDQQLGPVAVGMTEAERVDAIKFLGVADEIAMRDLLLRFESLGRSCEFGLIQRRFGAEPLGLLRWNGIPFPSLLRALEEKFSGFDKDENVFVTVKSANLVNEYIVRDHAYGTAMHSHVYKEHVSEEKVLPQQRRRVQFLLRKLIEEFEAGEKICVILGPPPTSKQMDRLTKAFRGLGQCPLLVVSPPTDSGQAGTVKHLGNRIYRGFVQHEGRDGPRGRHIWDIDYLNWMKVIKEMARLVPAATPASARAG